jgi:signal transduction histidine kinase
MQMAKDNIEKEDIATVNSCVDLADKSLRKLEILIRDILKLTEMKNKEEDVQEIDIHEMVESVFNSFSQLEGFEAIEKLVEVDHQQPLVTKKTRVNMILENLLSNSIKYYDPDVSSPRITVKTYIDDQNFILDVSDNGLGIPEDQKHKLFKMFNRFHPRVAFGSGLGLYLMKKSAEFLGGEIHYIDQPKGARFQLSIPQGQSLH